MPAEPDPRVYFAAERTLLAWLRTGLAVMGLGFVVARFGLFLRVAAASLGHGGAATSVASPHHGHVSTALGVALVGLAVAMLIGSARQYLRFLRTLRPEEVPRDTNPTLAVVFAASLALVGVGLAVSLVVWTK